MSHCASGSESEVLACSPSLIHRVSCLTRTRVSFASERRGKCADDRETRSGRSEISSRHKGSNNRMIRLLCTPPTPVLPLLLSLCSGSRLLVPENEDVIEGEGGTGRNREEQAATGAHHSQPVSDTSTNGVLAAALSSLIPSRR